MLTARTLTRLLSLWLCSLSIPTHAASKPIDLEKSAMNVHVFKSGVFSAFGHEHDVTAPIGEGTVDEGNPSATLRVDSRKLKVIDRDVSDEDRAKIQNTMLGPQVLDTDKFPEIIFKSTQIDRLGDGKWLVHGDLTLHGQTRSVLVQVQGQSGHYQGSAEVKQKDFGIVPVTAGGGSVKVKNEVRIQFDIWTK